MTSAASVRRVRLHEWREVRDLRIEAVGDPDASIAFLTTTAEELARGDAFWQARTAGAAMGESGAQFVAIVDDAWVGSATVLLREPGSRDHLGQEVVVRRADVVGVYLSPAHRGRGILGELFAGAAEFAAGRGTDALTLDVHTENLRAQAAYRKLGFTPTGVTFTSVIGPELEMRRPFRAAVPG
ncbi:GNAT family N-acetyltransferase [Microbacterium sp. RU33B]|uniref:GNAT family N-acetyltransferase n=1 Tax=Microbacterium sp. RU33B TaxID=1907390 RepID=UPI000965BA58|nr:GNAT family N-acetyltransferase [Microbacterium sp. RU33B]SIT75178.1 Ribosomal protein S18 acetylase RimI [Microbacterium sp. RU33B]